MMANDKNLMADGFELYWMKRILERENKSITLVDRIVARYYMQYHGFPLIMPDYKAESRADHVSAWKSLLNGNLTGLQRQVRHKTNARKLSVRSSARS
jgi:hypothetical protein